MVEWCRRSWTRNKVSQACFFHFSAAIFGFSISAVFCCVYFLFFPGGEGLFLLCWNTRFNLQKKTQFLSGASFFFLLHHVCPADPPNHVCHMLQGWGFAAHHGTCPETLPQRPLDGRAAARKRAAEQAGPGVSVRPLKWRRRTAAMRLQRGMDAPGPRPLNPPLRRFPLR